MTATAVDLTTLAALASSPNCKISQCAVSLLINQVASFAREEGVEFLVTDLQSCDAAKRGTAKRALEFLHVHLGVLDLPGNALDIATYLGELGLSLGARPERNFLPTSLNLLPPHDERGFLTVVEGGPDVEPRRRRREAMVFESR